MTSPFRPGDRVYLLPTRVPAIVQGVVTAPGAVLPQVTVRLPSGRLLSVERDVLVLDPDPDPWEAA